MSTGAYCFVFSDFVFFYIPFIRKNIELICWLSSDPSCNTCGWHLSQFRVCTYISRKVFLANVLGPCYLQGNAFLHWFPVHTQHRISRGASCTRNFRYISSDSNTLPCIRLRFRRLSFVYTELPDVHNEITDIHTDARCQITNEHLRIVQYWTFASRTIASLDIYDPRQMPPSIIECLWKILKLPFFLKSFLI